MSLDILDQLSLRAFDPHNLQVNCWNLTLECVEAGNVATISESDSNAIEFCDIIMSLLVDDVSNMFDDPMYGVNL